mmetsp:Transcript_1738/g.4919  ORF Transcript_1738/g.4919 Transcript_1738/m.4919 type:complete len:373 (+) Transcript_1738:355-1473(+)
MAAARSPRERIHARCATGSLRCPAQGGRRWRRSSSSPVPGRRAHAPAAATAALATAAASAAATAAGPSPGSTDGGASSPQRPRQSARQRPGADRRRLHERNGRQHRAGDLQALQPEPRPQRLQERRRLGERHRCPHVLLGRPGRSELLRMVVRAEGRRRPGVGLQLRAVRGSPGIRLARAVRRAAGSDLAGPRRQRPHGRPGHAADAAGAAGAAASAAAAKRRPHGLLLQQPAPGTAAAAAAGTAAPAANDDAAAAPPGRAAAHVAAAAGSQAAGGAAPVAAAADDEAEAAGGGAATARGGHAQAAGARDAEEARAGRAHAVGAVVRDDRPEGHRQVANGRGGQLPGSTARVGTGHAGRAPQDRHAAGLVEN